MVAVMLSASLLLLSPHNRLRGRYENHPHCLGNRGCEGKSLRVCMVEPGSHPTCGHQAGFSAPRWHHREGVKVGVRFLWPFRTWHMIHGGGLPLGVTVIENLFPEKWDLRDSAFMLTTCIFPPATVFNRWEVEPCLCLWRRGPFKYLGNTKLCKMPVK